MLKIKGNHFQKATKEIVDIKMYISLCTLIKFNGIVLIIPLRVQFGTRTNFDSEYPAEDIAQPMVYYWHPGIPYYHSHPKQVACSLWDYMVYKFSKIAFNFCFFPRKISYNGSATPIQILHHWDTTALIRVILIRHFKIYNKHINNIHTLS